MEQIVMARFGPSEDEAFLQASFFSRQTRQWISSRGPECHSACRVARHLRGGFPMVKRLKTCVFSVAALLMMVGALVVLAGCESQGPAEKAGASVDKGVQNVKDAVNPPGAGEKAGREVDKALKP
jgi:hypothetical protein